MQPILNVRTPGFANYAIAYSPFYPTKLGVASSANFGLVGNGRLHLFDTARGDSPPEKIFDTQDGLYDLAWSESHENQIVTASGDGTLKLWDIALDNYPIRSWSEHQREIFCVDWNNLRKDLFASSSWDHTIKIWTAEKPTSLTTINAHTACVYAAHFAPNQPDTLASCSSDGFLKVWDIRTPSTTVAPGGQPATPSLSIPAHPAEILSLDWNKYAPHYIATGSVDRTIRIHDLRMVSSSSSSANSGVGSLLGHEYAVRKVAWSPHAQNVLASCSYDMTARVWQTNLGPPNSAPSPSPVGAPVGRMTSLHNLHTEFVVGIAWSLYEAGVLATCSWDQSVHLHRPPMQ